MAPNVRAPVPFSSPLIQGPLSPTKSPKKKDAPLPDFVFKDTLCESRQKNVEPRWTLLTLLTWLFSWLRRPATEPTSAVSHSFQPTQIDPTRTSYNCPFRATQHVVEILEEQAERAKDGKVTVNYGTHEAANDLLQRLVNFMDGIKTNPEAYIRDLRAAGLGFSDCVNVLVEQLIFSDLAWNVRENIATWDLKQWQVNLLVSPPDNWDGFVASQLREDKALQSLTVEEAKLFRQNYESLNAFRWQFNVIIYQFIHELPESLEKERCMFALPDQEQEIDDSRLLIGKVLEAYVGIGRDITEQVHWSFLRTHDVFDRFAEGFFNILDRISGNDALSSLPKMMDIVNKLQKFRTSIPFIRELFIRGIINPFL